MQLNGTQHTRDRIFKIAIDYASAFLILLIFFPFCQRCPAWLFGQNKYRFSSSAHLLIFLIFLLLLLFFCFCLVLMIWKSLRFLSPAKRTMCIIHIWDFFLAEDHLVWVCFCFIHALFSWYESKDHHHHRH